MTYSSGFMTLGLCSLLSGLPAFASADTIVLMSDEWCPYNCTPGSENPGFMVEIASEALAPYGHEIDYQTLNWARSLHRAAQGEINGVLGAVPDEAPDFIFGPPIGTYVDVVAHRKGDSFDIDTLLDQDALKLGTINGYIYYGYVGDYIEAHTDNRALVQPMSGEDALAKNIRKLVAGRIDLVAEVGAVLEYTLASADMADLSAQVDFVTTDESDDIFIAFSPALASSQVYAEQLTEGVAMLKASGRFDEIMLKYGQQID